MDEFKIWFRSLPKFTRTYLMLVIVISFGITYKLLDPKYIVLNFNKKIQIWRFLTNFLIAGRLSMSFLFFLVLSNQTYSQFETKAVRDKRYAEFVMMLIYVSLILLAIAFFLDHTYHLSFELLFSLIYVDCKRNPEQLKSVWGIVVKNAYVPWVFTVISLMTGGNVLDDIVGIAAGFVYYSLKDYVPVLFGYNILVTPEFLANYLDNKKKPVVTFTRLNQSQERVPEPPPQMPNYQSSYRTDSNSSGNLYNQAENNNEPSWD